MPLFLKNKICFIHIPKCGGTTFARSMGFLNDPPIYYKEGFVSQVKNSPQHSPQHTPYKELEYLNLIPEDFDVISTVRNPYERFYSEYNWRSMHKYIDQDIKSFAKDFFESDMFWDNHEKTQGYFLEGCLDKAKIITLKNLNKYFLERFDFKVKVENSSATSSSLKYPEKQLPSEVQALIQLHWGADMELFKDADK